MVPFRLLLIDDDPDILATLQDELQNAGYRVSTACSVMAGLVQAREDTPDLILTDLRLPDGNGRDVVTRLRRTSQLPIIVLSARGDVSEKVALLELGADDYLVKPVEPAELLARIAVQLRAPSDDLLTLGALTVSPGRHLATLNGQDLHLTPLERALLTLMLQQLGRVYSRAEIVREVWDGQLAPDSNVIDVHMSSLRHKLHQHGGQGLLQNVRGVGYALKEAGPVTRPSGLNAPSTR